MKCNVFFLLVVASLVSAIGLSQQPLCAQTPTDSTLNSFPLVFEPNKGQSDTAAEYIAREPEYAIFLQRTEAEVVFPAAARFSDGQSNSQPSKVKIEFLRADKESRFEGVDLLPGKSNYLIGNQPSKWLTGIQQYGKVRLKSLYPGIDLIYHGHEGQLEFDFVVLPGADPGQLTLRIVGSDKVSLDMSGNLALQAREGTLQLLKPVIYQDIEGVRRQIQGAFVLRASNEIGVLVGDYDMHVPLVIDPELSYSTLIGANNSTQVLGVAADQSGDMYITGTTFATNYPTVNAFQSKNNGTTNVFVTKLNPAGNVILYSTYLGGNAYDNAAAIAVDASDSAYVTGTAGSSDFPTTSGAFMTTCPPTSCNTPFVSKFLSDGSLAFSTYMGGSNTPGKAIAVDSAGEAYITGPTASNDLPTTAGAFETTCPGGACSYVEKLNAFGTGLVYSTYFGSVLSGPSTAGSSIAVDSAGSAYLVGSTTGIPTQNPIQSSYIGSSLVPNAFITKFSPDGSALVFSTYLGGPSPFFFSYAGDYATGVAVDSGGNVHVTGTSSSCEFPLTLTAFNTDCVTGEYDQKVFVTTLNSSGTQILWSTFLQSGAGGAPVGIVVDAKGNTYVAGATTSNAYPVMNAIESTSQRSTLVGFVTELNTTGNISFSTYLGATAGGAFPAGIALDAKGGIYVAGAAGGDFPLLHPIPSEISQTTNNTIFAAKIAPGKGPQFSLSPRVSPYLTLRNVSSTPLTISSIVPSTNFTVKGNCGTSIAAGGSCNLILLGADDKKTSGTVTITSNAYSTPQKFTISKSPTGDSLGYSVTSFPLYLQFPFTLIGTSSATQQVTVQNLGLPAAINGVSITQGPYSETNNCPATLATGASCTISITYSAATGQDSGSLVVIHDPNQTQDNIALNGYGTTTAIAASISTVDFGTQSVGQLTLGRIVNLINATPDPATVTSLSASAGFAETDTCSTALGPHKECRVSVTFTPTGNQSAAGTLTVSNYGPGAPETISLQAIGIQPGDLALSPASLDFATGYLGIGGSSLPVTVTNTSQNSITIQSISSTSPFPETSACPTILAPAATCQIAVAFDPTVLGAANGMLQVVFVGNGSPQTIGLTGTGETYVQFYPSPAQFGQQIVNTTGAQVGVGLANYGTKTVTLGAITAQGSDFSIVQNTCGKTLARNTACGLQLVFSPSATGSRTGTLSVNASDYSQATTVVLQGTGISSGIGSLSASSLQFAGQKVGTKSAPQQITLTNTGNGTLTLFGIAVSPQLFTETNTCASTLAPAANCTISVEFAPTLQGILVGSLSVEDDGANGLHIVNLSGIGQ